MTTEQADVIMSKLLAAFDKSLSVESHAEYLRYIIKLNYHDTLTAVESIITGSRFFPRIADLVAKIAEYKEQRADEDRPKSYPEGIDWNSRDGQYLMYRHMRVSSLPKEIAQAYLKNDVETIEHIERDIKRSFDRCQLAGIDPYVDWWSVDLVHKQPSREDVFNSSWLKRMS